MKYTLGFLCGNVLRKQCTYKIFLKKANFFDKIFGNVRFFYYLCIVRETYKDKKKI